MSDTPETDHLEDQLGSAAKFSHPIIWRHARDLERERNEAREEHRFAVIHWQIGSFKMQRERDEARKELENEIKWHHQTHKELVEAQCKLLDIEYDKLKS